MDPEIIHRFVQSVGQKADVDYYVRLFRAQDRTSFAIIVADAEIVRTALDPLHFDLRILAGLGLCPVVLLGLFDADDANRQAADVHDRLVEDQVPARIFTAPRTIDGTVVDALRQAMQESTIPVVSLEAARDEPPDARFKQLSILAAQLCTSKVVFLSPSAGIEREGTPHISVINVSVEYEQLLADSGGLALPHRTLLQQAKDLLDAVPHRMTISVVNPLALLRELFTVKGAGTLVRKGSRIESHASLESVDSARLTALIESAFGRALRPGALEHGVEQIFVEENYRSVALLTQSPVGPYLSKFAVNRAAQGEGIGADVWAAMVRRYPTFFWRSRPDNPIVPWYVRQCDGLARFAQWHVFWRGLPAASIPLVLDYALALPPDFDPAPAG